MEISCKDCILYGPIGECKLNLSNQFGCSNYRAPICAGCFFYDRSGICKKNIKLDSVSCSAYELRQETEKFVLERDKLFSLCETIRCIMDESVTIRFDTDSSTSANVARGSILMFLDDIIVGGVKDLTPSFFTNYLHTIEPFMYMYSINCIDSRYSGCKAHIFEYPCGTQSLQIKVILRNDTIEIISFHLGLHTLNSLQKMYSKNASGGLLSLAGEINIWFGATKLESIFVPKVGDFFSIDPGTFFSSYMLNLKECISMIVQGLGYTKKFDEPITKVTVAGSLSVGTLLSDSFTLTNLGLMHANLTILSLSNDEQLKMAVVAAVSPYLTKDTLSWLEQTERTLLNRMAGYLP